MAELLAVAALDGGVVEVLEEVAGGLLLHLGEEVFVFFGVFGAFVLLDFFDLVLVVGGDGFGDEALDGGRLI